MTFEPLTEAELRRAGYEQVHVENERYDGPQTGVADIDGVPHYFHRRNRFFDDGDEFAVWPIDPATFALEQEQWRIYVVTDERGEARPARYHELGRILGPRRVPPAGAPTRFARWRLMNDRDERHDENGPTYLMCWT